MTKDYNFTKPIDATLLSYSILKRLRSGGVDTFEQRLKSQKYHYFAQLFGVVFCYPYNLYLRGPYSPNLAHDLYEIKKNNIEVDVEKFVPDELEKRFIKLKKFVSGKNLRQLEIIATLHWLLRTAKLPIEQAKNKLVELKNTKQSELNFAIKFLKIL